jgi:hypothetical protein
MFANFPTTLADITDRNTLIGIAAVVVIIGLLALGVFLLIKPKR